MARRTLVTVATVLALLVPLLATASPAGSAPTDIYVALGDSFTAGPAIPVPTLPAGCLKSNNSYPWVVNAALTPQKFRNYSCSGAQTDDMFAPQNVSPDGPNPPQLDAVTRATTIVTLQIGGNDIGFSEIVQNCAAVNPLSHPCRDVYLAGGVDEISRRITETGPKVASVLAAIRAKAPTARIFVVGYPQILPDIGPGCWPQMPVTRWDVPYLRKKAKELNAMIKARAEAAGAVYVDTYGPSTGRSACELPTVRWVEPIAPVNPAAPVHPNAAGMAGMGALVVSAIG
jgi:lysophospholipase L1-like esterase